jgi:hypothetical protein
MLLGLLRKERERKDFLTTVALPFDLHLAAVPGFGPEETSSKDTARTQNIERTFEGNADYPALAELPKQCGAKFPFSEQMLTKDETSQPGER